MTVLQLGPFPPPHGGVQTNLVAIRDHLRRHGCRAPVINLTRHRRENADDVFYPTSAQEVIRLLFAIKADVIHLHFGGELTPRLLGLCLVCCLMPGRRVVLTFHSGGYPSGSGDRADARSLQGWVLRRPEAVVAVNEEIANWFRRLGVEERRIRVICPFAPVAVPQEGPRREDVRQFIAAHAPLLTTVGLLEPEYDLALQIRAMEAIRRQHPGAGLAIVGSGSLEPDLRALIDGHPARGHILLCGDVDHADTIGLIAASDTFLRTTLYDGDSVSVREALQIGVPVVATDNGMRPGGVVLIPKCDEAALVSAITRTLTERPVRASDAVPAPHASLDETLDLYRQVLGRPIAPPHSSLTTFS
jgi:glycogen(starch) synthase